MKTVIQRKKSENIEKNKPINPGSTNNGSPGLRNPGTGNQQDADLVPGRDNVPGDVGWAQGYKPWR